MQAQADQARRFIAALTGDAGTACTFQTFDDNAERKDKVLARIFYGSLDRHFAALKALSAKGAGVFIAVNEQDGKGRSAANTVKVRALFVDCDHVQPSNWHLPPSILVQPVQGPHAYWLVNDCPLDQFRIGQKRLIGHYGSDPSVHDLCRVLRLPGFVHQKAAPVMVEIVDDPCHLYPLADVVVDLPGLAAVGQPTAQAPLGLPSGGTALDRRAAAWVAACPPAAQGERDNRAFRVACQLVRDFGLSEQTAWPLLRQWNATNQPPLSDGQLSEKIANAVRSGAAPIGSKSDRPLAVQDNSAANSRAQALANATADKSVPFNEPLSVPKFFTDLGNAERMAERYGKVLRYCDALGWLTWTGKVWQRNGAESVAVNYAIKCAKHLIKLANSQTTEEEKKTVFDFAMKSQSRNSLLAAVALSRHLEPVPCGANDFDKNEWLLNTPSGLVDLRSGKWVAATPESMCSKITRAEFDPFADCPLFEQFLIDVLPDGEVREFVHRFLGYACTGIIRDHVFPVWWGEGRNGKGTLIELVAWVLGDYAVSVAADLLLERQGEAHPTERMVLLGARLVFCSEPDRRRGFSMATVKKLTGGDTISAHLMHKDMVSWTPTHKLVMLANHKPQISAHETDKATWDRMRLVPWTEQFTTENGKQDTALPEKLRAEGPGILAWLVAGCQAYLEHGLPQPAAVAAATSGYKDETDVVGRWVADRCAMCPGDSWATVPAPALRRDFEEWCQSEGYKGAVGPGSWRARLISLGAVPPESDALAGGKRSGIKFWRAIRLVGASDAENVNHH